MRPGDSVRLELPGSELAMEVVHEADGLVVLTCACCERDTTVAFARDGVVEVRSTVGSLTYREPDFRVVAEQEGLAEHLAGGA